MITITKTGAICSLGENLDEIFANACAGKITDFKITADLPVIKNENIIFAAIKFFSIA